MNDADFEAAITRELATFASRRASPDSSDWQEAKVYGLKHDKGGVATEANPFVTIMAMPDLSPDEAKEAVRGVAFRAEAFLVFVKSEAWYVTLDGLDGETAARVRDSAKERKLHELEPALRREKLTVDAESSTHDMRRYEAEITRAGDVVTVGPWKKLDTTIPRPGWKRYLPEVDERGGRVRKIQIGRVS